MPVQIVRPRSIGVASGGARRAVLLTGALGVMGGWVRMLEFFTTYLQSGETKPSSLDQLVSLGARPLPDQRESLRSTVKYWAAQKGYLRPGTGQAA